MNVRGIDGHVLVFVCNRDSEWVRDTLVTPKIKRQIHLGRTERESESTREMERERQGGEGEDESKR